MPYFKIKIPLKIYNLYFNWLFVYEMITLLLFIKKNNNRKSRIIDLLQEMNSNIKVQRNLDFHKFSPNYLSFYISSNIE